MNKKILFLSTVNFAINPRVFKEIKLALSLGYSVSFVGFKIGNWTDALTQELEKELPTVNIEYINATRKPFLPWALSTITEKIAGWFYFILKSNIKIAAYASTKRTILLNIFLSNKREEEFDLVIAHTLGTLFPAYQFAKNNNIPFAFDVEDYHPGETINTDEKNEEQRRVLIMQKCLPKAKYVSAASPLIANEVNEKILKNKLVQSFCILNAFAKNEFLKPLVTNSNKLQLVWFSQNINYGRGLELFIPILKKYKEYFDLHLIGSLDNNFKNEFVSGNESWICILQPLAQTNLHTQLSNYDVGLATELSSEDYNREIALTNKIVAYYQAGLFILATNTKAQTNFLNDTNAKIVVQQNINSIEEGILLMLKNKDTIKASKENRFVNQQNISWENEQQKLIKYWN